jgi:hypothetical protein
MATGQVVGRARRWPGHFNTPYATAIHAQRGLLHDRGNRHIQMFDGEGKLLRQITVDVPVYPNARPAISNKPSATTGMMVSGAL